MTENKATTIKSLEKSFKAQNEETEDRLEAVEHTLGEMKESSEKNHGDVLKAIAAIGPKGLPASIPKSGKTTEDIYRHEDEHGIEFQKQRSILDEVELVRYDVDVTSGEFEEKADQLKFDQDILLVEIAPDSAYSSEIRNETFTLGVNGRQFCATRGVRQKIPRCFVEVMARAKISSFGNREVMIPNSDNEMTMEHKESIVVRYPFRVIFDPNKELGERWLDRVSN